MVHIYSAAADWNWTRSIVAPTLLGAVLLNAHKFKHFFHGRNPTLPTCRTRSTRHQPVDRETQQSETCIEPEPTPKKNLRCFPSGNVDKSHLLSARPLPCHLPTNNQKQLQLVSQKRLKLQHCFHQPPKYDAWIRSKQNPTLSRNKNPTL